MSDLSDAELLERFRTGAPQDSEAALVALMERYEAALFPFLVGMLRDHHQAEDALQETFVRALERLDGVDPEHWRGWLFTVAYHQALLVRRRRKRRAAGRLEPSPAVPAPGPGPLEQAGDRDEARLLLRLLERLPSAQQAVIRQRVYEGKRFREIATDLHCPLNT